MRSRFEDVDPSDLIAFANAWSSMGSAVSEQVESVLNDNDSWSEQNPNALRLAQERIGGFCTEIDEVLEEALSKFANESNDDDADGSEVAR